VGLDGVVMVMMRSTVERGCGSGVLISSGQEASVGLQNTACSGVAKRCVQSIDAGRNAYLRLSGCIFCFGLEWRAWTPIFVM
jgi:hypothetical protein